MRTEFINKEYEILTVVGEFPAIRRHAQIRMTILLAPTGGQSEHGAAADQSDRFARRLCGG